jgi:hypothetical protein
MEILLLLLLFFAGPPLLGGWLLTRFSKLSQVQALHGRARTKRLAALVSLAALITLIGYGWVLVLSEPIPGAHAASRSAWPWAHEHPVLVALLASMLVTLVLLWRPAQRLAGLSFGAGALLVCGGLGLWGYVHEHRQQQMQAMRRTAEVYDASGWQQAVIDSFHQQVAQRRDISIPEGQDVFFPGGDSALQQQLRRLVRPPAHRLPEEAAVDVECLVEADGRVALPHVVYGLGPGYDEEAVRVVQTLPAFWPGLDREGKPMTVVHHIAVPFAP